MSHPTFRPMRFRPTEFTEYYSPDGQKFRFDNHYRFMIAEEGFGMPGIDYISQKAPLQHGETMYDYRLQTRIIQVSLRENACSRQGYWDARANLLNLVRPNRQYLNQFELGVLRKILPDGSKRDIKCLIQEGPTFPAGDGSRWDAHAITETLRFMCPDPTFYNPVLQSVSWVSVDSSHLVLPFTFDGTDIVFADVLDNIALKITYPGTWRSYPIIRIEGPIANPIITNITTGQVIDLSAYSVSAAEVVTIDLSFGFKTVTSSINGNIMGYIGSASDLAEFAIFPDPTAAGGVNDIDVSGDSIAPGITNVIISYYTRYIGL